MACYRPRDRRGVTPLIIAGLPKHFTVGPVKRGDTGFVPAANDQHDRGTFDQRRAGDAEKTFRGLELLSCVNGPNTFARSKIRALKGAFRSIGVNAAIRNRRSSPRPL